jgi:hypothetical protein
MEEVRMATTLWSFETPVASQAGEAYSARACGRQREDYLWKGWIEFEGSGGDVLRSGRETTQPNLTDLEYWAQGLTPVYLEERPQSTRTRSRSFNRSTRSAKFANCVSDAEDVVATQHA